LLRSLSYGLDNSQTPPGGWVAWGLGLALGWGLSNLATGDVTSGAGIKKGGATPALLGIYLILSLAWFAFSAPAVIARWTAGSYPMLVIITSLFSCGWILLALLRPRWIEKIGQGALLLWNILFTVSLTATLLAQRVAFPPAPDSAPVVVTAPGWFPQILLVCMLLLFPVIFFDMRLFINQIRQAAPAPRDLLPGILLGSFILLVLVFANIFTNVWGYIEPLSTPFRNTFWLTFFLMTGMISLLAWRAQKPEPDSEEEAFGSSPWGWAILLAAIFGLSVFRALPGPRIQVDATQRTSLLVMTFNIQQANDGLGEKSYDRQLAIIRRVSPDILALQESDSTRISLNNNDYVRYFAENLGYYSYYGPTTVTGTFGTAILSKLPLLNPRVVFVYSDTDEIGMTEAEVEAGGRRLTIYDVHPDGSEAVKLGFVKTLLERSKDKPDVIALGDYNLDDTKAAYKLINGVYANAWASVYPSRISADGVNMSGDNRIDHIFISPTLRVRNPIYVLPPASASDHPVHWAEIYWDQP
jgi:endonuclease/exonuclease/phosphatase family metal-dependent hydrolase